MFDTVIDLNLTTHGLMSSNIVVSLVLPEFLSNRRHIILLLLAKERNCIISQINLVLRLVGSCAQKIFRTGAIESHPIHELDA